MKLQYCSLTGADNPVDPQRLAALSVRYPFVEWAVLLSPEQAGQARFPTFDWIDDFKAICEKSHKAMHLCGDALIGFVEGKKEIYEMMQGIARIQLNLKFGNVEGRYQLDELIARMRENPDWQFIIQYTPDKAHILPMIQDIKNHALLYDGSAGQGISPEKWDAPIKGHFCGYAGGLNPDNIQDNITEIARIAAGQNTWIDMETGIRTNDCFDLNKAQKVLEITAKFLTRDA